MLLRTSNLVLVSVCALFVACGGEASSSQADDDGTANCASQGGTCYDACGGMLHPLLVSGAPVKCGSSQVCCVEGPESSDQ